ncbi:hypothetical protein [Paraburkholderia terrae]|nr:hypothetical protein [Paraburkholderia terrae]
MRVTFYGWVGHFMRERIDCERCENHRRQQRLLEWLEHDIPFLGGWDNQEVHTITQTDRRPEYSRAALSYFWLAGKFVSIALFQVDNRSNGLHYVHGFGDRDVDAGTGIDE